MPQESAYTSINQIPAGFKQFKLGKRNLDWGGGSYDKATRYLRRSGTTNLVYDKFNRTIPENVHALSYAECSGVNSITVFNVLNVIQDKKERKALLRDIKKTCDRVSEFGQEVPVIIIQIYEGDRSGIPSKKTVQTNMRTVDYIPEIQAEFPGWEVQRQGNFLIV